MIPGIFLLSASRRKSTSLEHEIWNKRPRCSFEQIRYTNKRLHKHRCIFIFKCINGLIDFDFKLTTNNNIHSHNTRTSKNVHLPKSNTNWGKQKPTYQASNDFNNLNNTPLKTPVLYPNLRLF